ncbi:MAG: hypothetical protein KGJ86_08650 [Chloroflexota bacterium]|nr:hypothetical protein [Chloroflexota bacterium]
MGNHENEQGDARRALESRSVLHQNRDFFDQFFTRVVKTRFRIASDESGVRQMSIVVGPCNAARCQLTANGHAMVLMASRMASNAPEILVSYLPAEAAQRPPVTRVLRYQPPAGWVEPETSQVAGDLTTWLDLTISSFLQWSAGVPS